jgi:hypothetical protein
MTMSTTTLRTLVGFLIAPGGPALIVYLVSMMWGSRGEATWSAEVFAVVGYGAALVIGVPLYFLLQRKGIGGLVPYLVLGGLIGLICIILGFIPYAFLGDWRGNQEQAFSLLKTAAGIAVPAIISGVIASAVFWLIAIRRLS